MKKAASRPNATVPRPRRPPRLAASLSTAGPVAFRPGEAIVDLNRFDGGIDALDSTLERINGALAQIEELEIKPEFRADEADRTAPRARISPRAVRPEPSTCSRCAERVNDALAVPAGVGPNTVFRIGAFTADPMTLRLGGRRRSDARSRRRSVLTRCTSPTRARRARPARPIPAPHDAKDPAVPRLRSSTPGCDRRSRHDLFEVDFTGIAGSAARHPRPQRRQLPRHRRRARHVHPHDHRTLVARRSRSCVRGSSTTMATVTRRTSPTPCSACSTRCRQVAGSSSTSRSAATTTATSSRR